MFLDVIVFPWEFFAPGLAGLAFALVAVVVAVTLLLLRRKERCGTRSLPSCARGTRCWTGARRRAPT